MNKNSLPVNLDSNRFGSLRWGDSKEDYPFFSLVREIPWFGNIYKKDNDKFYIGDMIFDKILYSFFYIDDGSGEPFEGLGSVMLEKEKYDNYRKIIDYFKSIYGEEESKAENEEVEIFHWEGKRTGVEVEYKKKEDKFYIRYYWLPVVKMAVKEINEAKEAVENSLKENPSVSGYPPVKCPYCGGTAEYLRTRRVGSPGGNIEAAIIGGMLTKSVLGGLLTGNLVANRNNRRIRIYKCRDCGNLIEIPE